jgi:hypothetical protein
MTILSAMQSAAVRLVGYRPSVFFTSSEQFELEISDLVNEVAQDICKYSDWQALTKVHNIPTDGVTDVFPMPDDYDRQLLVTDVQDLNNWIWGYHHTTNFNDFLFEKARNLFVVPGTWTIYQNSFHFTPPPASGNSATFPYVSLNYAINQAGNPMPEFAADTDEFIIRGAERLLTLGLVWRWRENKKLDYTGDQEAFMMLIDQLAAKDKGSNVQRSRSRTLTGRLDTRAAWPFTLG